MLEALDLTEGQARCYELLVEDPVLPADRMAERAGVHVDEVERALADLEHRGLISRSDGHVGEVIVTPPDVALEILVLERQEELERVRRYAAQLSQRFRARTEDAGGLDYVEVVHGRRAIGRCFEHLQRTAQRDLIVLVKHPFVRAPAEQADTERELLDRGVRVRGLYERAALEDPDDLAQVTRLIGEGEQARVTANVPVKLAIADAELALLPVDPVAGGAEAAFLVHPCGLLDTMVLFAELLWRYAAPVATGTRSHGPATGDEPLAPGDRRVLDLLQTGLTDQGIARRLGISERTVGRRIRRLMDAAGAETRFQLGWRAEQRGWLGQG